MRLAASGAVLSALLLTPPLSAQNWLENGEFDTGTPPWQSSGTGLFQWDELDRFGGEGSVLFSSTDAGDLSSRSVHQCVRAHEGDTYDTIAWYFIPLSQGATGYAQLFVNWYSDENCGSSPLAGAGAPIVSAQGSWIPRAIQDEVAPPGTIRARVFLQLTKNSPGSEFRVHADGAQLLPHPFFADGFGAGNVSAWSDSVP